MECRLYLDVDCSNTEKVDVDNLEVGDDINQQALKDVVEALNDTIPAESNYDPELTNQAFCNLIDRYIYCNTKIDLSHVAEYIILRMYKGRFQKNTVEFSTLFKTHPPHLQSAKKIKITASKNHF